MSVTLDVAKHLSAHVFGVPRRTSGRREGVLNLSSNELLHSECERFWRAFLQEAQPSWLSSYPLYEAATLAASRELETIPERTLLTAGSDDAIRLVAEALMTTTGRAILGVPTYEGWEHHAAIRRVDTIRVDLGSSPLPSARTRGPTENRLDALIEVALRASPSVVVLASPTVGVGAPYTHDELARLSHAAARAGHLLVIDECYWPFAGLGAGRAPDAPHVVVVRSFSKAFGLAGARVAALSGAVEVVDYLARFRPENPVSGLALAAVCRAVESRSFFDGIIDDIVANRTWISDAVRDASIGLEPLESSANFVHFRMASNEQVAALRAALLKVGIRVRDASNQPSLERTIRATIGDLSTTKTLFRALVDHHP
ncbi:MAG TPA: aminotransferase class I/II-fold pyridoxal phosphate-dependent enzyme [Labilithrix sp.]|nr:aminotransferase class I/II-fold pyridoxal phosphate-dependent enzyme [Labilithrix sp.]